ncbi:SDR family oxidoreductase [Olivibacter sp. SDN3]|uniref:NAD(P)-dependent oxidoreductase n=1 Tax=Olivibacter sp. SDN3 TaxID=2764720 RepID=UPI00165146EA|nr:SDR family oxidoreductase [Olivibacter sp. SDN3]QNL47813.1 SDR family oxidoreductase [Olivibacter sp. SDN3]
MKIFLFGSTGGTGKEILLSLLEDNFQVTALARDPSALAFADISSNFHIVKGNVYDPESYQEELGNCDVVISTLGPRTSRSKTEIYSKGGQAILSAMRKAKIKRLITLTAAAFDPNDPNYNNFLLRFIVRPLLKNIYVDMQKWEDILEHTTDISWTCIRPSRLTNGSEKGNYRIQQNYCPNGGRKISRKDLANFVISQIHSTDFIHKKPAIAY